ALVEEILVYLDRVDAAAAAGDQLGDARAHQAEPDHRHLADLAWLDNVAGHAVEPFVSRSRSPLRCRCQSPAHRAWMSHPCLSYAVDVASMSLGFGSGGAGFTDGIYGGGSRWGQR